MALQLVAFFENNGCFTSSQFGFRKGKNTTLGILNLVTEIMDSSESLEHNAVLFCDLSKAFDCVSHSLLLKKLKFYKFSATSIQLIHSYLADRTQVVKVGGVSSAERVIDIGVPQGSVLGPILFLIYVNDLPFNGGTENFTLFADDTTISLASDNVDEVRIGLGDVESSAKAWFAANELILNEQKTNMMIFSLRNMDNHIQGTPAVKFLGLQIDNLLRWDVHIDCLCKRLNSAVFAIRNLSRSVSVDVLRTAYYALFHSLMSYGVLIWGHAAQAERVFKLQRRVIRILRV